MYQAPGGLNASMRPSHDPAMAKAGLAFRSEPLTYDRRDVEAQRQLLTERFAGAGWQTDVLLAAAAQADDFYFDAFAQVHMPGWSAGRVALVGAYLLAGEPGTAGEGLPGPRLAQALTRYGTRMRPYVDKCQDLPAGIDGYAPMSGTDIAATALVMKYMQRRPFRGFAEKKWFTAADSMELPDYVG